jgi:hypothetical protein
MPSPPRHTRGSEELSFKVIHDQSTIASAFYFEPSCAAVLAVNGNALTFTSLAGGETPLTIPASEILEIRLNATVSRDAGAFHILTRDGLYLALAPEHSDRDHARELLESLRAELGLPE